MKSISRITVSFGSRGVEIDVTYTHDVLEVVEMPGSKGRTSQAARLASMALERTQDHLRTGRPLWGGYATNLRTTTDRLLVDKVRRP
jgi:hypothetical protein